jgi:Amyloid A4 N-terminal heparin-binding
MSCFKTKCETVGSVKKKYVIYDWISVIEYCFSYFQKSFSNEECSHYYLQIKPYPLSPPNVMLKWVSSYCHVCFVLQREWLDLMAILYLQVFPDMDVRNVVESAQQQVVNNWCKVGESNCDQSFTIRPYRCLGDWRNHIFIQSIVDHDLTTKFTWCFYVFCCKKLTNSLLG